MGELEGEEEGLGGDAADASGAGSLQGFVVLGVLVEVLVVYLELGRRAGL
ncbi:hypothetical protein ABTY61_32495 [Kitasatospora sp. NPDC096128]